MTAYRGTTITYDSLGNPLSYYNGNSYTFTWANGRQLASTVKGGITTTYTYNADGIRIGKTVGSTAVEYVLDGTQIVGEKNGSFIIRYLYDAQGLPVGMILDSTTYLFEKNLQGDVIGIYTTGGTKIASYTYDAWGNIVSSSYTSGYYNPYYYNPFRYRGYYYDTESGFYYLQSRYYDPATGRFLNADGYVNANGDLQGFNMYAYCSNNPVMAIDPNGQVWDTIFDIGFIIWGIADIINSEGDDWKSWVSLGVDVLFAAIPFIPSGAGRLFRVGNKIDNVTDVASAISKIDNLQDTGKIIIIGRNADRVSDTAKILDMSDSVFKAWKGFDNTSRGLKRLLHNSITWGQNLGWVFGKIRTGATIIDIGLDTSHVFFGIYYGMERMVIGLWRLRNIWKVPLNYYM